MERKGREYSQRKISRSNYTWLSNRIHSIPSTFSSMNSWYKHSSYHATNTYHIAIQICIISWYKLKSPTNLGSWSTAIRSISLESSSLSHIWSSMDIFERQRFAHHGHSSMSTWTISLSNLHRWIWQWLLLRGKIREKERERWGEREGKVRKN